MTARVLAVIPCLNEAAYIEAVAMKLLSEADELGMRIVIADGGSSDGTRAIAERLAAAHEHIVFLDNPRKLQSAALNLAAQVHGAGCEFLIRVDAHGDFPEFYCRRLLEAQGRMGADSVVVSMVAAGDGCFQRAAAAAQNSRLGNGGSSHRLAANGRWVDHGHHALMRLAAFQAAGGYDESFSHNEDAELDIRLKDAGFRIWLTGETGVTYFPRRTASALFRQYVNYGRGRARNLLKHRQLPKLRQSLPLGVAPAIALALLGPLAPVLALPALTWAALCLVYGGVLGVRAKDPCVLAAAGIAAMLMHLGWSSGFWDVAARHLRRKISGRDTAALPASERMGEQHDN